MTTRRSFLSLLTFGALAEGAASRTVRAQPPAPSRTPLSLRPGQDGPGSRPPLAVGQSPQMLLDALPFTYWPPSERGALLVIAPDRDVSPNPRYDRRPPARTESLFRLNEISAVFDRSVVNFGSLSAAVPTQTRALRRPGRNEPEVTDQYQAQQLLAMSLTPNQWARMGSSSGLGLGDLNADQQPLFLSMLPDPLRLQPTRPGPDGRMDPVDLSPAQRRQVRIRATRQLTVSYIPDGASNSTVSFGNRFGSENNAGGPRYTTTSRPEDADPISRTVAPTVPNRPKVSDLDTRNARFDAVVSLADAKTVDELVGRIARACRVELYADARAGGLSVYVRGDGVRAGDLLDAICRSVCGTVRKVASGGDAAYVITDDRDGIGSRMTAIGEWRASGDMKRWRMLEEQRKKMAGSDPSLTLPSSDPDVTPEFMRKLQQSRFRNDGIATEPGFPVNELPASLQEQVRKTLAGTPKLMMSFGDGPAQERTLRADRVVVSSQVRADLLLPNGETVAGLNSIDSGWYGPPPGVQAPTPPPPPAFRWPVAWKTRAVLVSPGRDDELPALAAAAKAVGANALWVTVDCDAKAAARLSAAIDAGSAQGLSVVGVVSLLAVDPAKAPGDAVPDVNILGETSAMTTSRLRLAADSMSYMLPASARNGQLVLAPTDTLASSLAATLLALAKTPKLGGLALRNVVPDGYIERTNNDRDTSTSLGYLPANRLAFLRQNRVDPIDLPAGNYFDGRWDLPFFPGMSVRFITSLDGSFRPDPASTAPNLAWQKFRAAQATRLRTALHARLAKDAPDVALWLDPNPQGMWLGRWEKGDAIAPGRRFVESGNLASVARTFSKTVLGVLTAPMLPPPPSTPPFTATDYRRYATTVFREQAMPNAVTWDGYILDLAGVAHDKALEYLAALGEGSVNR